MVPRLVRGKGHFISFSKIVRNMHSNYRGIPGAGPKRSTPKVTPLGTVEIQKIAGNALRPPSTLFGEGLTHGRRYPTLQGLLPLKPEWRGGGDPHVLCQKGGQTTPLLSFCRKLGQAGFFPSATRIPSFHRAPQ